MREFIRHNFWLKLFSLFLAILVYIALQPNLETESRYPQNIFGPRPTREFHCRVDLLVSAADRQMYEIEPSEVAVQVRGDENAVAQLSAKDIQVYVDLALLKEVQGSLEAKAVIPRDVSLISIAPTHITVKPLR